MVQWPRQLVWYQQGPTLPSRSLHLQKLQREQWREQRDRKRYSIIVSETWKSVLRGYCTTERLHFYSRVYSCPSFLVTSTRVSNDDEAKAWLYMLCYYLHDLSCLILKQWHRFTNTDAGELVVCIVYSAIFIQLENAVYLQDTRLLRQQ